MGQLIVACAKDDADFDIVGTIDHGNDLNSVISRSDVVIDFTNPAASLELAKITAAHTKALVIGTTGHSNTEKQELSEAVREIPVVWSSNFSTGVNVLFYVARAVAQLFPAANVEIAETHHTKKKDAPSGTAKRLQEILTLARGENVQVHSFRVGDVIGDHTVTFATKDEKLEFTHSAIDRATFARGALRAAKWIVKQKPGFYDMQDVLGLKK